MDPTTPSRTTKQSNSPPSPPHNTHHYVLSTSMALPPPPPSLIHQQPHHLHHLHHPSLPLPHLTRRSLLLSTATTTLTPPLPDTTITDRVFLDFSLCSTYLKPDRTLSDSLSSLCTDSAPLGRLVLGLYGKLVPVTVSNFKAMCTSLSYKNTLVHKIFPGQFFLAGKQGRKEKGEVKVGVELARNIETVDSNAFRLRHERGGVLSLCLSENDDDEDVKLDPEYRNVEFFITTGPGPCPQLDSRNIVFGTVLEGMDVVTAIAAIPTYKPSERIRQFNDLAEFFGDERAQNARALWNRPLKTVFISDCGEVKVTKPTLYRSLP